MVGSADRQRLVLLFLQAPLQVVDVLAALLEADVGQDALLQGDIGLDAVDHHLAERDGRRGSTAQSLRALLRALGTKNDARYNLKIVNNESPAEEKPAPVETPTDETVESESDFAKNTRKALAELDDLDV